MPGLPEDLLDRRPEEAARLIALWSWAQVRQARERFRDPDDDDALHDLRVALRRFRSALRAYRPLLRGSGSAGVRRRLRKLARTSGPPRDAEVQLEWLQVVRADLDAEEQKGLAWLTEKIDLRRQKQVHALQRRLHQHFPRVVHVVEKRLPVYRARVALYAPPAFRVFLSTIVETHLHNLMGALGMVEQSTDIRSIHRVRIEAKRLRYLVEPFTVVDPAWRSIRERLKRYQDQLGALHDAHLMTQRIEQARPRAPKGAITGLEALAKRSVLTRDQILAELTGACLGDPGRYVLDELRNRMEAALATSH